MSYIDYTPTPTRLVDLAVPDGSENLSAATTNVPDEQLADGIAYLDQNMISERITAHHVGDAGAITTDASVWSSGTTSYEDGSTTIFVDITDCLADDRLTMTFTGNFEILHTFGATGYDLVRMVAVEDFGGAATLRTFDGYAGLYATDAAGTVLFGGVAVVSSHVVITPGTLRLKLQVQRPHTDNVVRLKGGYSIVATRIRPTAA